MSAFLTKPDLDKILNRGCTHPGCEHEHEHADELYFHSKCHPEAATWVKYTQAGLLVVECAKCHQQIAVIDLNRKNPNGAKR